MLLSKLGSLSHSMDLPAKLHLQQGNGVNGGGGGDGGAPPALPRRSAGPRGPLQPAFPFPFPSLTGPLWAAETLTPTGSS